jgi:hypothetical protein
MGQRLHWLTSSKRQILIMICLRHLLEGIEFDNMFGILSLFVFLY